MSFVLNKLKSRIFSDISQILPKLVHLKYMNAEFSETCVPLQQLHIINIKISQKKVLLDLRHCVLIFVI